MNNNPKLIEDLFEKGILVSKDLLEKDLDPSLYEKIEAEADMIVLNSDYVGILTQQMNLVDWYEIDSYRVEAEKGRDEGLYQSQLQEFKRVSLSMVTPHFQVEQQVSSLESTLSAEESDSHVQFETTLEENNPPSLSITPLDPTLITNHPVSIVVSFENKPHKYDVKNFTSFFISRYRFLEGILRHRQEMENVLTINRVLGKKEKEKVSIIGIVDEIGTTKNGNIILSLEDLTGKIKVVISKTRKDLLEEGKSLIFDEVIGISGVCGDRIVFAENIVWPDIPATHQLKKGEVEEYAVFLSDIHVGSTLFLEEEFNRFLSWVRGEAGNEDQRQIASKVKYVIIAGDLVDGVGIYPAQEEELAIPNIRDQYTAFSNLIRKIPPDKQIIMCPGNHDVVHLAEPQSVFYKEFAPALFEIPHTTLVSNPSIVNIGKTKTFPGFDILLYHGYSFDYYVNNVESIRNNGGYHRADLIMKFLLKRRHLAPSFRSTPYFPAHEEDPLLITKIPDFLITGHIHYSKVANYKGITMISGSCWQGKTSFQEKLGHQPEPARVPVVNLKTREVKILKFM